MFMIMDFLFSIQSGGREERMIMESLFLENDIFKLYPFDSNTFLMACRIFLRVERRQMYNKQTYFLWIYFSTSTCMHACMACLTINYIWDIHIQWLQHQVPREIMRGSHIWFNNYSICHYPCLWVCSFLVIFSLKTLCPSLIIQTYMCKTRSKDVACRAKVSICTWRVHENQENLVQIGECSIAMV
jgi:hypothetical protein